MAGSLGHPTGLISLELSLGHLEVLRPCILIPQDDIRAPVVLIQHLLQKGRVHWFGGDGVHPAVCALLDDVAVHLRAETTYEVLL